MRLKILSKRTLLLTVFILGSIFFVFFLYFFPKKSIQNNWGIFNKNFFSFLKQKQSSLESQVNIKTTNIDIDTSAHNIIPLSDKKQTNFGLPVNIEIPNINVDAPIEYVGFTSDGAMDVPKGPVNVAWLNLGPRPGENGSAVIAGHYDWKNNASAVFSDLHKLSKGDKIYIKDEDGVNITFAVREIQIYKKDDDASAVFNLNDGKSHLNLITCAGVWNKLEKTRSERLIVFADKE